MGLLTTPKSRLLVCENCCESGFFPSILVIIVDRLSSHHLLSLRKCSKNTQHTV